MQKLRMASNPVTVNKIGLLSDLRTNLPEMKLTDFDVDLQTMDYDPTDIYARSKSGSPELAGNAYGKLDAERNKFIHTYDQEDALQEVSMESKR